MPVEATRIAGEYALPVAAPELTGDRPLAEPGTWVLHVGSVINTEHLLPGRRDLAAWLHSTAGQWAQLALVLVFLAADASRWILDVQAMEGRPQLAQSVVLAQTALSFVLCFCLVLGVFGREGILDVFVPKDLLLYLCPAVLFSLGHAFVAHAISLHVGLGAVVALGLLYMPLCALVSCWCFHRTYGWLEAHALALLTLSTLSFAELRSRAIDLDDNLRGSAFVVLSSVCTCAASILLEALLKSRYRPRGGPQSYLVQKTRLDFWGLATSVVVLFCLDKQHLVETYREWRLEQVYALLMRMVQAWMAGLLAKRLSTVAKAVLQCISLLIVFFLGDQLALRSMRHYDGGGSLQITLLAVIVALSALMYQMGRQQTVASLRASAAAVLAGEDAEGGAVEENGNSQQTLSPESIHFVRSVSDTAQYATGQQHLLAVLQVPPLRIPRRPQPRGEPVLSPREPITPENHALCCSEDFFSAADEQEQEQPQQRRRLLSLLGAERLMDPAWLAQANAYSSQLANWVKSSSGTLAQFVCVIQFILSDSSRTIVYDRSINGTPIVQQSVVLAASLASIIVGVCVSAALEGRPGTVAALSLCEALRCLPVAACFSLGQTFQIMAYGVGVSGIQNTVVGYTYMPLSALLSRWIFRRAYSSLEWLALTLLVLSASTFVLLQRSETNQAVVPIGFAYVLISVLMSCTGSVMAERIMKSGQDAFYIQKVHLEVGGLATAAVMLFVCGLTSSRPNDAFWKPRDIGGGEMQAGVFVGWSWKTWLALITTLFQSWLGGVVAKRLSTVVRAVAQCMSLLIIYFVGDLALKHLPFDWVEGTMAVVVALTVQVFSQAGRPRDTAVREDPTAVRPAATAVEAVLAAPQEPRRPSNAAGEEAQPAQFQPP